MRNLLNVIIDELVVVAALEFIGTRSLNLVLGLGLSLGLVSLGRDLGCFRCSYLASVESGLPLGNGFSLPGER